MKQEGMMAVRRRIAVLSDGSPSRGGSPSKGGAVPHAATATEQQSSLSEVSYQPLVMEGQWRSSFADLGPTDPKEVVALTANTNRREKEQTALKLWREWAEDALGPMSAEPSPKELSDKSIKVKRMERQFADLSAKSQRRLEASSIMRSSCPSGFSRQSVWAEKEMHKQQTYAAVREFGKEEAGTSKPLNPDATLSSSELLHYQHVPLPSHSMTKALLQSSQSGSLSGPPLVQGGSPRQRGGTSRPQSARPLSRSLSSFREGGGALDGSPGCRPLSAAATSATRRSQANAGASTQWEGSGSPSPSREGAEKLSPVREGAGKLSPGREGSVSFGAPRGNPAREALGMLGSSPSRSRLSRQHSAAPPSGMLTPRGGAQVDTSMADIDAEAIAALHHEAETMRVQLDEARSTIDSHADLSTQLRDTIDMLRARLHAQSTREVENQRRLLQHAKLEPLFEQLKERFTFSTPQDVVARLEFLEGDKMGTFDQLLEAQEEVTALQRRLEQAVKNVDIVKTQMSVAHIQSVATLQQENERLKEALEVMESLHIKLVERQEKLVDLQTAVLDLFLRCRDDPSFVKANTGPGGANADDGSKHLDKALDPQAALTLVHEYVLARSPQLATAHYLNVQRVANRVWQNHLSHKTEIRGKVVQTFEQLSMLTDVMANKIKMVNNHLKLCKENEQHLQESLSRVNMETSALEDQLEVKKQIVREYAGVPRRNRPSSALPHSATSTPGGSGPSSEDYVSRMVSAAVAKARQELGQAKPRAPAPGTGSSRSRPVSAPSARCGPMSGVASRKKEEEPPRIFVVSMSQRPSGTHWGKYTSRESYQETEAVTRPSTGALVATPLGQGGPGGSAKVQLGVGGQGGEKGKAAGGARPWVPPERSSIESSFLSRLERSQ